MTGLHSRHSARKDKVCMQATEIVKQSFWSKKVAG